MVRADAFDYIDRLLKYVKRNNAPFGGIQVILVGDFHQLPPVSKREDEIELKRLGYLSPFIFHAKCFQNNFKCYQLHEVLRQKGDPKFIELLHLARTGEILPKHIKIINKQVGHPGDIRISLTARNLDAEQINKSKLAELKSELIEYGAIQYGKWPDLPCDAMVSIKVGAQVMVKKNGADKMPGLTKDDFESKVVNGTMGIVTAILPAEPTKTIYEPVKEGGINVHRTIKAQPDRVVIKVESGEEVTIYRQRWELKEKRKDEFGKYSEEVIATFDQMPLILAWAISMHKSQGQSFDKVHINPRAIFADGQLYVALSRCRTLAGISLETGVLPSMFKTNMHVINFYDQLEEQNAV
jgi:ATP-dependent exoDNAse (exonuclease V) alpha subunit